MLYGHVSGNNSEVAVELSIFVSWIATIWGLWTSRKANKFFTSNTIYIQANEFQSTKRVCLIRARGARWLSGRVSDSGARGPGFETYRRRVVSLSKTLYSPKYWLITQEAMAPSRHDWKIVDWDVKPQHNQLIRAVWRNPVIFFPFLGDQICSDSSDSVDQQRKSPKSWKIHILDKSMYNQILIHFQIQPLLWMSIHCESTSCNHRTELSYEHWEQHHCTGRN